MQQTNEMYESERFAELQRVRLDRVYSDPVITHSKNADWGIANSDALKRHIITARMKRLRTSPADDPIELATLPEAVAYLASASMDAGAATGAVPVLYHLAMREYTKEYNVEGPEWLDEELENEEYHRSRLDDLRRHIKQSQDRQFKSEGFEDLGLETLSKDFWRDKGVDAISVEETTASD